MRPQQLLLVSLLLLLVVLLLMCRAAWRVSPRACVCACC